MGSSRSSNRRLPWHIRRTGFREAWRLGAQRPGGQRPVRIAILDSGVDLHHSGLSGLLGPGMNLLAPGEPPEDDHGHGTHVAGIIASASGAWWAEAKRPPGLLIHPVKIFDRTGFGRIGDIVRGLQWCAEHNMEIVNLSFGTDLKTSRSLERAIGDISRQGILLVGAAGNDGRRDEVDFPGRYPEVMAVAATTRTDRLAAFSSSGPEVDVVAPGAGVLSLAPGGGFIRMSGTSMAAPHVSAAAAILLGLEPHLSAIALRRRIRETAEWLPSVSAQSQGAGLLRADRLLRGRPL